MSLRRDDHVYYKEKINKIQEDIARIEEASAILEPVNI